MEIKKFRSMSVQADLNIIGKKLSHQLLADQDVRATDVGKVIRATDLDELPQILNVLTGELTLVGLRCVPASDVEEMDEATRKKFLELYAQSNPGIINLKSLFSKKPKDQKNRLSYDVIYARKASLGLDLFLVFKSGEKFVKAIKKTLKNNF